MLEESTCGKSLRSK